MNVSDSMTALQKTRQPDAIVVTASHAHCDGIKICASFKQAVASSGKKRAAVIKTSETELRRSWWTLLYW
jgi:PleD family two-component response regulator